jgi:2-amino-4-hydroxy-6-hydroxymethyldihydropteridine diphosphokinase
MTPAWIGLGANLGDPPRQLQAALAAMAGLADTELKRCSPSYWTEPWGGLDQPAFLNAVALVHTRLPADQLLAQLLQIEAQLGRRRDGPQWGPRELDLDILVYGNAVIDTATLQVPHPHLHERAFVLMPWADVAPEWEIPGLDCVAELLQALPDDELATARRGPPLQSI